MEGLRRGLRRVGVDIRSPEAAAAFGLFCYCFLLGTFQFASKTVRQSTFVDSIGADKLPFVYLLVAICAYPFLRYYSRLTDRMSRHRLIIYTSFLIAASLVFFWWLFGYPWPWIRFAFYVWISIATVMAVSQFWSYSNHVFDPRQARRLFGFIGAGGLLGGVAGGQLARLTAGVASTRASLLAGASMLVAIGFLIPLIQRASPKEEDEEGLGSSMRASAVTEVKGGFDALRRSRHLQLIGGIMLFSIMVAQIVDLQFNWVVEQATEGLDERTATFGALYSLMGLVAFLFQLLFTSRIHRTLGVGFAMRVLPVATGMGTTALLLTSTIFPIGALIPAVSALKIGELSLRYSLDQSTRELLFVPVPANFRLKGKAYIDVLVQRFARGAAALMLLTVPFGILTVIQTGWISLALIVIWLGVTVAARQHYVSSLREGLVRREMDPAAPIDPADATTLEVLVECLGSVDPRKVLYSLDLLAARGRGKLVPPLLLYHDDPEVRQRTLQVLVAVERKDAIPLIERVIADSDPDVRAEAIRALAVLLGRQAPEMMLERLRDPDVRVRAAAISCLANQKEERWTTAADEALRGLLSDADPAARGEAAKAIGEIEEPAYRDSLVNLLYDADLEVMRQAILTVKRRVSRWGTTPIYVPILISLLRDRRLKHDVREALVACGEEVIPALIHFMNDPEEQVWVRRGLPKTIARLGTPAAKQALLDSLGASDPFLRRKVIESVASFDRDESFDGERIEQQIVAESSGYLENLIHLCAVSERGEFTLAGPLLQWREGRSPNLLQQLLAGRLRDHLRNIFRLLSLFHSPRDIWAAYERLVGDSTVRRSHALEYLDNILSGAVRRPVLVVIDDLPLGERLRQAKRLFDLETEPKVETLRGLMAEPPPGDTEGAWIAAATIHAVWEGRVTALYPEVSKAAADCDDPLVAETAVWVASELERATA